MFWFFLIVLSLFAVLSFYVLLRARRVFRLRRLATAVLILLILVGPPLLIFGRLSEGRAPAVMGTMLMLGVALSAVFLMHVDFARFLYAVYRRFSPSRTVENTSDVTTYAADLNATEDLKNADFKEKDTGAHRAEPLHVVSTAPGAALVKPSEVHRPFSLSRREALVSGAALLAGPTTATYASLLGRHDFELTETAIPIPGLPRALEGFKIVQFSDIHIGQFVGDWELKMAVDLARKARGDLIVLTGDLIDHDERVTPQLGALVRRLGPLARHGVVAIPGNHDYYAGIDSVIHHLEQGGATVLVNDGVVIGGEGGRRRETPGLAVLGVDDLWARRGRVAGNRLGAGPDLDRAIAAVPSDLPRVLLCHQPEFFHDNAGAIQLQLSGHTHGGQVGIGYDASRILMPHGYIKGVYERHGGTLYVNRGFGTAGPPARLASPPEVSQLVLVSA